MKRQLLTICCYLYILPLLFSQTTLDKIPQVAFDSLATMYNYTYWDANFMTGGVNPRKFTNQASAYNLNVNYNTLNIHSLAVNTTPQTASAAFGEANATTFSTAHSGNIHYAVLQAGSILYEKSASPTNFGLADSQLSEFGTWLNRRFVSTNFTSSPSFEAYFTGIEFTNWHNRFKITFHLRPTSDITDAALQLAVDIPSIYASMYSTGDLYAFADGSDAGFAVKGGISAATTNVTGNTVTINTATQTLTANTSYEVSLIFYAIPANLSTTYTTAASEEAPISITTAQTLPNTTAPAPVSYDADEGLHYIDMPRYGMGYTNCSQEDDLQNVEVSLENTTATDKRVRLCFRQIPSVNVVGFNSMIRNNNGDPSGLPVQVSKNWHSSKTQLYSGNWIKEYTEIIVPANTTVNFDYTRTGAKWGETYGAFSHQLSVVGAGIPRASWLEAGLGSFGENVTHSPDYQYGSSNVCDVRPFLVTNQAQGGTSSQCNWTGNVGGFDMWVYVDDSNQRIHQKEAKTRFKRYSPNLTETSVSAYSSDDKLKLDYTFYLNRSDDFTRIYYKIRVEALQNASFNRFDIFQLGGDNYNVHKAQSVFYGNDLGVLNVIFPTNDGSNDYTTAALAIPGANPWLWAGDGLYTLGPGGININTNNGMIIRNYEASFSGMPNNLPYVRERSSSTGFSGSTTEYPTSYCIVPPPGITTLFAGDYIELLVETVILPKQGADYYGPNANFAAALATYGNSVNLFRREVTKNAIVASSTTNTVDTNYPLNITTIGNTASVSITGGAGYVPVIFSGMDEIMDPKLWRERNNCWELVDQSNWGKDFWQADFNCETGLWDLVYNVNQDVVNDETATINYYLGDTPPVECSMLNDADVAVTAYLQGPFNGTDMNTDLTALIPLNQPYPYAEHNGTETLTSIPANMVDWVLIKLRDTVNQIEYTRAALLLNDGKVVDLDGSSPVTFEDVILGMYHVSVHHRNHLGVMTDNTYLLGS